MKPSTYIPEGYYLSPEDYAKRSGVSPATVKRKCKAGELRAIRFNGSWLIPTGSLLDQVR